MIVEVVEFCTQWKQEYEREAEKIKQVLSSELVAVHHLSLIHIYPLQGL